jgi:hypothetical protein
MIFSCSMMEPGQPCVTMSGYSGLALARSLARAHSSWPRELMSSLVKILPRWYWTVRALRNRRVPISGLDRPSRASRAITVSWAVSASRVWTVRLRAVSPVASSSMRARSAKASMPIAASRSWAVRSCSRASIRRPWRRSHSP